MFWIVSFGTAYKQHFIDDLPVRPDFTRTTKKRKSAIRSLEFTIKKESQR